MPSTVVNNPNRWMVSLPSAYRNLIQQEPFTNSRTTSEDSIDNVTMQIVDRMNQVAYTQPITAADISNALDQLEEALGYMWQTREEGDRPMPIDTFDNVVEYIDDQGAIQNITAGDITTNTMDINNTVNTAYWTRPTGVSIEDVVHSERGESEIMIRDEYLRERVEQLGVQVKILSDMVGEMKEFVTLMGFDKLLGGLDGKKTER